MADESTTPKHKWLRRVRTVVLCLIAGAMINVLVAWGCVLAYEAMDARLNLLEAEDRIARMEEYSWTLGGGHRINEHTVATIHGSDTLGFTRVDIFQSALRDPVSPSIELPLITPPEQLPYWCIWRDVEARHRTEFGAGWPFRSLYGRIVWRQGRFGIVDFGKDDLRLPVWPIWLGFVGNAPVYATLVWSLWLFGFAWPRRALRARRGLCPSCAYDLRGAKHDVCPECGK